MIQRIKMNISIKINDWTLGRGGGGVTEKEKGMKNVNQKIFVYMQKFPKR